jgi:hypothetical protein
MNNNEEVSILLKNMKRMSVKEFVETGCSPLVQAAWVLICPRDTEIHSFCISLKDITRDGPRADEFEKMRRENHTPTMYELGWTDSYWNSKKRAEYGRIGTLGSREQWKAFHDANRRFSFVFDKPGNRGQKFRGNINALIYLLGGDVIGTKPYWVDTLREDAGTEEADIVCKDPGEVILKRVDAFDQENIFAKKFRIY